MSRNGPPRRPDAGQRFQRRQQRDRRPGNSLARVNQCEDDLCRRTPVEHRNGQHSSHAKPSVPLRRIGLPIRTLSRSTQPTRKVSLGYVLPRGRSRRSSFYYLRQKASASLSANCLTKPRRRRWPWTSHPRGHTASPAKRRVWPSTGYSAIRFRNSRGGSPRCW